MTRLFPDVQPTATASPACSARRGARFFFNGALRGEVRDAEFARLFFGIWLSPQTSEPALREALLGPARGRMSVRPPCRCARRQAVAARRCGRRRRWRGGWATGLLRRAGLPLAFVALPLYVVLPNHYASEFGIPLATLGALLLARACSTPWPTPGSAAGPTRWFARSARGMVAAASRRWCWRSASAALFFPAVEGTTALLWWCAALLRSPT
jgi:hypothetical protein